MKGCIEFIVRLIRAGRQAYARKWSFLGVFTFVFLMSVATLEKLNLLPEIANAAPNVVLVAGPLLATSASMPTPSVVSELPTKIEIPKLDRSVDIMNPTTAVIATLDKELRKGVVRYPTSAKLGEAGNVILFGHSSYLPVVGNQAYKAFNNIKKLVAGDTIIVYSSSTVYTYHVRTVEKKVAAEDGIPLSVTGRMLTLTTCNSFGNPKENRFVVTADFVESHSIST